jgi:hypothetical protein
MKPLKRKPMSEWSFNKGLQQGLVDLDEYLGPYSHLRHSLYHVVYSHVRAEDVEKHLELPHTGTNTLKKYIAVPSDQSASMLGKLKVRKKRAVDTGKEGVARIFIDAYTGFTKSGTHTNTHILTCSVEDFYNDYVEWGQTCSQPTCGRKKFRALMASMNVHQGKSGPDPFSCAICHKSPSHIEKLDSVLHYLASKHNGAIVGKDKMIYSEALYHRKELFTRYQDHVELRDERRTRHRRLFDEVARSKDVALFICDFSTINYERTAGVHVFGAVVVTHDERSPSQIKRRYIHTVNHGAGVFASGVAKAEIAPNVLYHLLHTEDDRLADLKSASRIVCCADATMAEFRSNACLYLTSIVSDHWEKSIEWSFLAPYHGSNDVDREFRRINAAVTTNRQRLTTPLAERFLCPSFIVDSMRNMPGRIVLDASDWNWFGADVKRPLSVGIAPFFDFRINAIGNISVRRMHNDSWVSGTIDAQKVSRLSLIASTNSGIQKKKKKSVKKKKKKSGPNKISHWGYVWL